MKMISRSAMALTLLSGAAFAQQPPDVVISDEYYNTAMGTSALLNLTPSSCPPGDSILLGCYDTASGYEALYSNTTGSLNTAFGSQALYLNTTGSNNTAFGASALNANTTGVDNAAAGAQALYSNTAGYLNTASGANALFSNTIGGGNTASGGYALYSNTTGSYNTSSGTGALQMNTTGSYNTASGLQALLFNTTGSDNTAFGAGALSFSTVGNNNTAVGTNALLDNKTGNLNTAVGLAALEFNTTGNNNIALGYRAGYQLTSGDYNIEIGNAGAPTDNKVIKIGAEGTQIKTFIAGIYGKSVTGSPVYVASNGELGTVVSSERFKTGIEPMGTNTEKLTQLRPVTFRLKSDPKGALQYGLIAEEVAKVYPELVIRDGSGRIDGVRYDELAPMLLNEMQKEDVTVAAQVAEIRDLKRDEQQKLAAQDAEINELKRQLAEIRAALLTQANKDQSVAQR